jgi:hypothetical protein
MLPFKFLTPNNACIFRIVHFSNVEWILNNGLHCSNSESFDPNYVEIGNKEIIERRQQKQVVVEPFGTLSDYIPFYFTPSSMMLFNIVTGHNVDQKSCSDIVIFVLRLSILQKRNIQFVFTNGHALLSSTHFYRNIEDLGQAVDWELLKKRDFKRDNEDLGKLERYQAEALVYRYLPSDALEIIVCATQDTTKKTTLLLEKCNLNIKTITKPDWFFL